MATIKSFTDLSQSKKLAEILPLESADMCYMYLGTEAKEYENIPICAPAMEGDLCAWSLSALLGVLPEYNLQKTDWTNKTEYKIVVTIDDENFASKNYDNPVDTCVAMIEKLHELNLL